MTPAAIEAVLADFRTWLEHLGDVGPEADCVETPPVDLHTVVAQMTALRHEVNLQTRAARGQQDQNSQTLKHYADVFEKLEAATEQVANAQQESFDSRLEPLLKGMIEIADAQILATRELQRVAQRVAELLARDQAAAKDIENLGTPRVPFLARVLGIGHLLEQQRGWMARMDAQLGRAAWSTDVATAASIRQRVDAAAQGLTMGLQRMERIMAQFHIEPMQVVGQAFDPERMAVLGVECDSGHPAGEVLEEVQRGYTLNGRVFRFAQVRVAK